MKVKVELTVEIDQEVYAREYNLSDTPSREVQAEIREYVRNQARDATAQALWFLPDTSVTLKET